MWCVEQQQHTYLYTSTTPTDIKFQTEKKSNEYMKNKNIFSPESGTMKLFHHAQIHMWLYLLFHCGFSRGLGGGYIMIESQDGLSNRLRLLAGYMYINKVFDNISHVVMIWDVNEACPGHFLELFHPINGVSFISRLDIPLFAANAMAIYPPSYQNFLEVLRHHYLPIWQNPPAWHEARKEMYMHFRALPHVNAHIAEFVERNHICNNAAIHVRHTDLDTAMHAGQDVGTVRTIIDKGFDDFISSLPPDMMVFLMTDNVVTQNRRGFHCIVYVCVGIFVNKIRCYCC